MIKKCCQFTAIWNYQTSYHLWNNLSEKIAINFKLRNDKNTLHENNQKVQRYRLTSKLSEIISSLEQFVRQNCCQFQTEKLQKYAIFILHKNNLKSTVLVTYTKIIRNYIVHRTICQTKLLSISNWKFTKIRDFYFA